MRKLRLSEGEKPAKHSQPVSGERAKCVCAMVSLMPDRRFLPTPALPLATYMENEKFRLHGF